MIGIVVWVSGFLCVLRATLANFAVKIFAMKPMNMSRNLTKGDESRRKSLEKSLEENYG